MNSTIPPITLGLIAFWLVWSVWLNLPLPHPKALLDRIKGYVDVVDHAEKDNQDLTGVFSFESYKFATGFPFTYQVATFDLEFKQIAKTSRPLVLIANVAVLFLTLASLCYASSEQKYQLSTMFLWATVVAIAIVMMLAIAKSEYGYFFSYLFPYMVAAIFLTPIPLAIYKFVERRSD